MINFRGLYPNLPGTLVEFKDGGLALKTDPNPPATGSLLLLGTAIDGPVNTPVAVDPTTASVLFGSNVKPNGVPNGSTLITGFEEAYKAGCRDIRLMRISGEYAKASLECNASNVVTEEVKREQLGTSIGNDATEISLVNKNIKTNSVSVSANGNSLSTGITVNDIDGIVSVAANTDNGGALLTIGYTYYETVDESAIVDSSLIVTLTNEIKEIVSIQKDGVDVTATQTVDGNTIEFASGGDVTENDTLVITYVSTNEITTTENNNGGNQYVLESTIITKDLAEDPNSGSVHLYGDNAEILTVNAYTIVGTPGNYKIALNTAKIPMGVTLMVTYTYSNTDSVTATLDFVSKYAGEVYNQAKIVIEDVLDEDDNIIGKNIILTKPDSKKLQIAENPISFSSLNYPTLGQLVNAINNNKYTSVVFEASTIYTNFLTTKLKTSNGVYLSGGNNGLDLTKQEMFEALSGARDVNGYLTKQGAYQMLMTVNVDWIVPLGIYADDELSGINQNFAYELAICCAHISCQDRVTFGAMSMKPLASPTLSNVQDYANYLINYNNNYYLVDSAGNVLKDDSTGESMDIGSFVNIIAGPEVQFVNSAMGYYFNNIAVSYAALSTVIPAQDSALNLTIPNSYGIKYRLSLSQQNDIIGNRFVIASQKSNGTIYIVDDMTAAQPTSDYSRRSTTKVVKLVTDQIREICNPYLGKPNTQAQRNSMGASIDKILMKLKENGVIQGSRFNIVSTLQDQLLGKAKIELTIIPALELRQITTVVSLSPV